MTEQLSFLPPVTSPPPAPARRRRRVPKPRRKLVTRRKKAPEVPQGPQRVSLTIKHTINGVSYGPGVVEVEASLAASLRENEDRNIREERGLREERSHIILSGGRTVQVPNDTFDNPDAFIGLPVSIRTGGQQ